MEQHPNQQQPQLGRLDPLSSLAAYSLSQNHTPSTVANLEANPSSSSSATNFNRTATSDNSSAVPNLATPSSTYPHPHSHLQAQSFSHPSSPSTLHHHPNGSSFAANLAIRSPSTPPSSVAAPTVTMSESSVADLVSQLSSRQSDGASSSNQYDPTLSSVNVAIASLPSTVPASISDASSSTVSAAHANNVAPNPTSSAITTTTSQPDDALKFKPLWDEPTKRNSLPSPSTTTTDSSPKALQAAAAFPSATVTEKSRPAPQCESTPDRVDARPSQPPPSCQLPRKVEEELRDIYAAASSIANFTVAHINQASLPRTAEVQAVVLKTLSITHSLTSLLSIPEVASNNARLEASKMNDHGFAAATANMWDGLGSSHASAKKASGDMKTDSGRKRQRSTEWKDDPAYDYIAQSMRERISAAAASHSHSRSQSSSGAGFPLTPVMPAALRVMSDGTVPLPFPSLGGGGGGGETPDFKSPQYKKRSRAPAPGSCQACGTCETPEWRRGPDGARTLCNACGLHYAKLVRKRLQQEGNNEDSNVNHSNNNNSKNNATCQPIVTIEELRASNKSNELGGGGGMTESSSSASIFGANGGTPQKGIGNGVSTAVSMEHRLPLSSSKDDREVPSSSSSSPLRIDPEISRASEAAAAAAAAVAAAATSARMSLDAPVSKLNDKPMVITNSLVERVGERLKADTADTMDFDQNRSESIATAMEVE